MVEPSLKISAKMGQPRCSDREKIAIRSFEWGRLPTRMIPSFVSKVSAVFQYILHFGDHIVSRKFLEWVQKIKPQNYTLVTDHDSWYNPTHLITHRYESDISSFINSAMNNAPSVKRNDQHHE